MVSKCSKQPKPRVSTHSHGAIPYPPSFASVSLSCFVYVGVVFTDGVETRREGEYQRDRVHAYYATTAPRDCRTCLGERRRLSRRHVVPHRDWQRTLADRGLIYKDTYEGYYSTTDECFYPSSRVTSHPTLPNTKVSTETGAIVEWSSEVNYKLRLSKFREVLLAHYTATAARNATAEDGHASRGVHPEVYQNAVMQDLKTEPLEDLSISRPRERIGWGIPVPEDPSQTVYVWFDALLVYLSGVGYPATGTGAWPPDVQVVGKDIVRYVWRY